MRIGFFDSGLGGLAVLTEVVKTLPHYEYLYYGDTAHLPYGDRTEAEISQLTKEGISYLFERGCALVIVACNTASAETLRRLQDTYLPTEFPDRRILGVIIPTIEELIQSGARQALLLATKRTVDSKKYEFELKKRNITHLQLRTAATPKLVPLIENGDIEKAIQEAIASIEAEGSEIDSVILGCTHYSVLKEGIRAHFGDRIRVISQDEIIPRKLAQYLMRHSEIEKQLGRNGTREIFLTGEGEKYQEICAQLFTSRESYNIKL